MASILDTLDRPDLGKRRFRRLDPRERIARNSKMTETGCRVWTGALNNMGYGMISVNQAGYKPETFSAHKAAYELNNGRVPDGKVLDHICRNRACVNPDHLEVVTQRENTLRSPDSLATRNSAKTHCPQGHEYTPENTYIYKSKSPRQCTTRICKACRSEYARRYYAAKRARRKTEAVPA